MEVGDINNDGVVDLYDAIEVARTLLPKNNHRDGLFMNFKKYCQSFLPAP